jgi:hypothetical protein
MTCKICNSTTRKIFEKKILNKYLTGYHQCDSCYFVQTDEPMWLNEAYSSAITSLDIGLVDRNLVLRDEASEVIDVCFHEADIFLDYAGGYGLFVRLMRDRGFNFYRQDIYCENIFAKHFDVAESGARKFDVATAFEVFEHFSDPWKEINTILGYSDTIIFSTKLLPENKIDLENWWYIAPETGQHIAFYHSRTLEYIASRLQMKYYFNNANLHVFTRKEIAEERKNYVFKGIREKKRYFGLLTEKLKFGIERKSLLPSDFERVKAIVQTEQR